MKGILKNKKVIIYSIIVLIIIAGIVSAFVGKFNYTLMFSEHKQIDVYLGKTYDLKDIKQIAEETFNSNKIVYREIETFHDSISINVKEANEEQIKTLESKLKEKYEISGDTQILETTNVAHIKGIDIIKPYITSIIVATVLVLIYTAIRYFKLGVMKVTLTMFVRIVAIEALLLSIIAIFKIQIGTWTLPIAIFAYMLIVLGTTIQYENEEKNNTENKKKKK